MLFKKRTVAITLLAVFLLIGIFIAFDKNAETIRNGIKISLQEDFKIKETLGQVFFLDKDEEDISVSSNITVTSFSMPCKGEISKKEILGEPCIVIYCDEFESVLATANGVIENCGDDKISIRHDDGKLSNYFGAVCILPKGKRVSKGENIGYAKSEITYRLYENCVALDPLDYLV